MLTWLPAVLSISAACSCVAWVKSILLTLMIWSPLRRFPLKSAGPPVNINDINMPSPPSPPTILKPRPDVPLCKSTRRGSLEIKNSLKFFKTRLDIK